MNEEKEFLKELAKMFVNQNVDNPIQRTKNNVEIDMFANVVDIFEAEIKKAYKTRQKRKAVFDGLIEQISESKLKEEDKKKYLLILGRIKSKAISKGFSARQINFIQSMQEKIEQAKQGE